MRCWNDWGCDPNGNGGALKDALVADEFETEFARYLYERSEEARAVRVGEKETSEQAAIVARYAGLFTRAQRAALATALEQGEDGDRERLFRLKEACEGGIVSAELAERSDALENAILACRVDFEDEPLALRAAQAKLAVVTHADREYLGRITLDASADFNGDRLELMRAAEALEADLSGQADPVRRSAELKQIDLHVLDATLREASSSLDASYEALGEVWLDRVLGEEREAQPSSAHVSYVRRLSPLAGTYTKERSVPVCVASLASLGFDLEAEKGIRPDLDDRPQKNPRACVIASDPPRVVHLITRAQGGLSDYMAFLHEAGHALHYAGCDPTLPYTYRRLSRDHALTEIIPCRVADPRAGLARRALRAGQRCGCRPCRGHAIPLRRVSSLRREARLRARLLERLRARRGVRGRVRASGVGGERFSDPRDGYVADMDGGFYSADYLRAWIRAAQVRAALRQEVGDDWWRRTETGDFLRELFRQGTRPSSEDVAAQVGFEPFDTAPSSTSCRPRTECEVGFA